MYTRIQVRLYQVLDPARMYTPEGVKLLDFRRVSTLAYGWEVFKVKDTLQQWINDSLSNHGKKKVSIQSRCSWVDRTYRKLLKLKVLCTRFPLAGIE